MSSIFREKAIASFSSPEKLDEMIDVLSLKLWMSLLAVFIIMSVAALWGWFGRIDTKVSGAGMLMNPGLVRAVSTRAAGTVKYINVEAGSPVEQNEVIGVVDQPLLEIEIKQLVDKYILLKEQFDELMEAEKNNTALRDDYFSKVNQTSDVTIARLMEIQGYLKELSDMYKELRQKGITSKVDFYQMLQNSINAEVNVTSQRQYKYKLPVEKFDFLLEKKKFMWDKLKEIKLTLNELEIKRMAYMHRALLRSPVKGVVADVIKSPGDSVSQGENVFIVMPDAIDSLQLNAYVGVKDWKKLKVGQLVYISPTNIEPQRYGSMLGVVRQIGIYPATGQTLESVFKNMELAKYFKKGEDVVIPVTVELIPSSSNPTGVKWTCKAPADIEITFGMPCNMQIVVERRPPVTYVIPWLREKFFGTGKNLPLDAKKSSQPSRAGH